MKLLTVAVFVALAIIVLHPRIDEGVWNKAGLIAVSFGVLGVAFGDTGRGLLTVAAGLVLVLAGRHKWHDLARFFHLEN